MNKRFFGATDVGRMRQNNEDAFFVQPVLGGTYLAACVIDGVGGYEGGEVAAQIAQQVLPDYLRIPSGDVPTMMQEAMIAANEKIQAEKRANPALSDMACVATLVLADEAQNVFHYVHVGDTRLYLFRDGSLVKVSKDQSFVGFLEDSGRLPESEAMHHPKRNEINKALGFDAQIKRDYFDSGTSPFLPGDMLLLCSDGLTDLVPVAAIKELLEGEESLEEKCNNLIDAANAAGGKDNITVVLLQHSRQPQKQRALKPKTKQAPKEKQPPKEKAKAAPAKTVIKKSVEKAPQPVPQPLPKPQIKSNKAVWTLGILCALLAAALVWLLYRQYASVGAPKQKNTSETAVRLLRILDTSNTNTIRIPASLTMQPVVLSDSIRLHQDSLHIMGNGLHLKGEQGYEGAGILLAQSNRYLLLQDVVLEDFAVGILAKGQTVRLKNVQFLNCAVPVQYGYTVPVNSPVNVTISDTLFTLQDTLLR